MRGVVPEGEVEQARATGEVVTGFLRAVATVPDDAPLTQLLTAVEDVLAEHLGGEGIALVSAGDEQRVLASVGALADLEADDELPDLGDQLGHGVVELPHLTVRSRAGTRRRPGRMSGLRSDSIVLLVADNAGPVEALPALIGVLDVEVRRRAAVNELTERVKELKAHRRVQAAVQARPPLPQLLAQAADALRGGLRYSEAARVEIDLDGHHVRVGPEGPVEHELGAELTVEGVRSGSVQVGYVGPYRFLEPYETALVAVVAETLEVHLARERAHRDRAVASERLASLVRSSALAVVALDHEGGITAWNQGAERLLGWSAEDVEGTRLRALLPADASGHDLDALRRIIEAGGSLESFEVRLRHRDGRYRELEGSMSPVLDPSGRATGYSVIYRDVGERNAALRRLAENEELFRRLAESSQDVVYRAQLDQLLPHVEYVSPSARQRLGFDAAQLVADPDLFSSRIHPDDRDETVGADSWDAEARSRLQFRFQHADGRWLWLDDRRSPLTDAQGRVVGLSGVLRDITSEVESEQRLRAALERERRAADQLRRVDEMKTTFLSAVSHELRTPLTSILGFALTADRALSHRDRDDPVLTYVRRIVANAERLQALISDLLDVDRLAREAPEPRRVRIDVADLVRDLARRADRAGRRLYVEVPGSCEADVDVLMVERTVHSLLDNALRHTPAGTEVTVRLTADATHLSLVVEDDGPGVPEHERAGLFAPFAQGEGAATAANPGTGIGLALVDRFVRVHGGQVHLDERPGGGARVTVDLPRWGPDEVTP